MSKRSKRIVALLAVLAALCVAAALLKSSLRDRPVSPIPACIANLMYIEGAKDQWAREQLKTTNDTPAWDDLIAYWEFPQSIRCPQGGRYTVGRVGELPKCSIGGPSHTLTNFPLAE